MLNARCLRFTHTSTKILPSPFLCKEPKSSKFKLCSARHFAGHNPNSTKFQLANSTKRLDRFFSRHTTNFAAGSAGPKVSSWSRTWWGGSYCGQPNGLALSEDCTHEIQVLRFWFFNFFLLSFALFFVAVNTMSLLGIQTTICVSLNSK